MAAVKGKRRRPALPDETLTKEQREAVRRAAARCREQDARTEDSALWGGCTRTTGGGDPREYNAPAEQ